MTAQPTPLSPELPDATAAQAKAAATTAVRRRFNELLYQASQLCQQADQVAALGGLSDIEIQQARAAAKLSGVTFCASSIQATPGDFRRLDDDLRHIARSVDPLILAIGEDAKANSHALTARDVEENFKDVIFGAIDGNALFCLEECVEAATPTLDDIADDAGDHKRKLLTAE